MVYTTNGTCARAIDIEVEDGIVIKAVFIGGCDGNSQGISALVSGMSVSGVISRLEGIKCGRKDTSCPDQLAKALRGYIENNE